MCNDAVQSKFSFTCGQCEYINMLERKKERKCVHYQTLLDISIVPTVQSLGVCTLFDVLLFLFEIFVSFHIDFFLLCTQKNPQQISYVLGILNVAFYDFSGLKTVLYFMRYLN